MENDGEKLEFLVSLSNLTFLSLKEKNILLNNLDSSSALALLSIDDICRLIGRRTKGVWNGEKNRQLACRSVHIMNKLGISVVLNGSTSYPALLAEAADAPFLLFCRGSVSCLRSRCVSVVGTRKITAAGRKSARSFGRDAAVAGYTVVSGLAYGTDGEAHAGAVDAYFDALEHSDADAARIGRTCAVLPGGLDEIVPYGHKRLAARILESDGCLVSECAPGIPVEPWRFVQRNRIIAALSPATVVVEAPPGSGALITADFAVEYGRDVVFLAGAFSDAARATAEQVTREKIQAGRSAPNEEARTAAAYVADGAPVAEDFEDFCRCLAEKPGTRRVKITKDGQLELFGAAGSEEGEHG